MQKMRDDIFKACMDYFNSNPKVLTWETLNTILNKPYVTGEALRSAFKRERKARNIIVEPVQKEATFPKIVCFDIETSPLVVYTFNLYGDYINPENVISDQFMISWSAKLLNDSKIYSDVLSPLESVEKQDGRIVKSLWDFLNGSQILIGHNIKDFDLRFANTRFLVHGLEPISHYQVVDTLVESKKNFRFESNSLKYINKKLGIKQKIENEGMALWVKCLEGKFEALRAMSAYCDGDVSAVEELYYRIRPYISGHPNIGLMLDGTDTKCPNCGSDDTMSNGYYFTQAGKYESVRCNDCGAISRRRKDITDKDHKNNLLRN